MAVVLDASALLAYWLDEPGAEIVTAAVSAQGALTAAPNFAEALTKLVDRSPDLAQKLPSAPQRLASEATAALLGIPLAAGAISVEPFTMADAIICAELRPRQGPGGCRSGTERAWGSLRAWAHVRSQLTRNGPR